MRTIFCKYSTGLCGMEGHELMEIGDDMTDDQINEEVWLAAVQHAESYGIETCSDENCQDEDCELEHSDNSGIEGSWEDYDPEKHDMYL